MEGNCHNECCRNSVSTLGELLLIDLGELHVCQPFETRSGQESETGEDRGTATGYGPKFECRQGQELLLFPSSIPASFSGVKWPEREADHSPTRPRGAVLT
jgi:hypothetical protein